MPTDPETADFVQSLPDDYLLCRVDGHMKPRDLRARTAYWDSSLGCYVVSKECPRCGRISTQHQSSVGTILKNLSPTYPEGYLHTGGGRLDTHDRDALRLETNLRTISLAEQRPQRRRRAS